MTRMSPADANSRSRSAIPATLIESDTASSQSAPAAPRITSTSTTLSAVSPPSRAPLGDPFLTAHPRPPAGAVRAERNLTAAVGDHAEGARAAVDEAQPGNAPPEFAPEPGPVVAGPVDVDRTAQPPGNMFDHVAYELVGRVEGLGCDTFPAKRQPGRGETRVTHVHMRRG